MHETEGKDGRKWEESQYLGQGRVHALLQLLRRICCLGFLRRSLKWRRLGSPLAATGTRGRLVDEGAAQVILFMMVVAVG